MKVCKKCGLEKPKSEFTNISVSKDLYSNYCKDCEKIIIADWLEHYKQKSKKQRIKGNAVERGVKKDMLYSLRTSCVKCGENRKYVIDFHHIDPSKKKFNISQGVSSSTPQEKIEAEVAKCVCLCRNCHQEFHHFYGMHPRKPVEALEEYLQNDNKHKYEIIECLS